MKAQVFDYKYQQGEIVHHQSTFGGSMESLESKIERLPPEQHKEVEDFVDFLLFRSGIVQESPVLPVPPRILNAAPPLIVQEPVHILENPPSMTDGIPVESSSRTGPAEQPAPFREISVPGDDRIARDYMDYGKFDRAPSPAATAVTKVKEKLRKQEEEKKPRVSLDWI